MDIFRINVHQNSPLSKWAADVWRGDELLYTAHGNTERDVLHEAWIFRATWQVRAAELAAELAAERVAWER